MNKGVVALATCICFFACQSKESAAGVKFQLYYAQGETIYATHCANCHQKTGKGLGLLYPSLEHSDYMDKNFNAVVCMIRYGKKGELIVSGKQYNQPMPGAPSLTQLEIAELTTYIYNTWGNKRDRVEFDSIGKALDACSEAE